MDDHLGSKKLGKHMLVGGGALLVAGLALALLSRASATRQLASALMFSCGGIAIVVGLILTVVTVKRVEAPADPRSASHKLKLGTPGFLAGLPIGFIFLFVLPSVAYWAGLGVILVVLMLIVVRRGTSPAKNWHIAAGGFAFAYGLVYAMQLCLAPFSAVC
jgi:hypothetical protein